MIRRFCTLTFIISSTLSFADTVNPCAVDDYSSIDKIKVAEKIWKDLNYELSRATDKLKQRCVHESMAALERRVTALHAEIEARNLLELRPQYCLPNNAFQTVESVKEIEEMILTTQAALTSTSTRVQARYEAQLETREPPNIEADPNVESLRLCITNLMNRKKGLLSTESAKKEKLNVHPTGKFTPAHATRSVAGSPEHTSASSK